ncbi:hypothetical protein AB0M28_30595 [Streptomyces sp. NPDC051940]|uniref:hypothetical protein n=1 Tax=Streptomyces sp. NPDC051940 TaxID=3155675 RepID=UPI00341FCCA5
MDATYRRREPGRVLLGVLGVLAVGVVAALVWLLLAEPGGGSEGPVAASSGPTTAPASEQAAAGTAPPPTGFQWATDEAGVLLPVPRSWLARSPAPGEASQVYYDSPDRRSLLQLSTVADPGSSPYDSMVTVRGTVAKRDGFRLIRLERVAGEGQPVELEFEYTHPEFGTRHVLDRAFVGSDGRQYALLVAGPAEDPDRQRALQRTVLRYFCVGESCPAG